jgi:type II secretory ATPase GspE/PulE/Tfp pilus assembly ATPase PilB-like protein
MESKELQFQDLYPEYWQNLLTLIKRPVFNFNLKDTQFIHLDSFLFNWTVTIIQLGCHIKEKDADEEYVLLETEKYLSRIGYFTLECRESLKNLFIQQLKIEKETVIRPQDLEQSFCQTQDALNNKIFVGQFVGQRVSELQDIQIAGPIQGEIVRSKIKENHFIGSIETLGEYCVVEKNYGTIEEIKSTTRESEPIVKQNRGIINRNYGRILQNSHIVQINYGRLDSNINWVEKNFGFILANSGTIGKNTSLKDRQGGTVGGGEGVIHDYYVGNINGFLRSGGVVKNNHALLSRFQYMLNRNAFDSEKLLTIIKEAREKCESAEKWLIEKHNVPEKIIRESFRDSLKEKFYEFISEPDPVLIQMLAIKALDFCEKNLILPIEYRSKVVFVTDEPAYPEREDAIREIMRLKGKLFKNTKIEIKKALWLDILNYLQLLRKRETAKEETQKETEAVSGSSPEENVQKELETSPHHLSLKYTALKDLSDCYRDALLRPVPLDATAEPKPKDQTIRLEHLVDEAIGGELMELIYNIIVGALLQGVSAIHIDPDGMDVKILYRIDGQLEEYGRISAAYLESIISSLKTMAKLNHSEPAILQKGEIKFTSQRFGDFSILVAIGKTVLGEKATLKILQTKYSLAIEQLNWSLFNFHTLTTILDNKQGILLVCGGVGSGVTTTLYAILNYLKKKGGLQIVTAEKLIEKQLQGVHQFQLDEKNALDYPKLFNFFDALDPDVLMIGELSDQETLNASVQMSLQGRLIVSALRVSPIAEALIRLCDYSINLYLLTSQLLGVLNQRFVRALCPDCKISATLNAAQFETLQTVCGEKALNEFQQQYHFASNKDINVFIPQLNHCCKNCEGRGYRGRIGIQELISISTPIKQLMLEKNYQAIADALTKHTDEEGVRTLGQDAVEKIFQGLISFDDAISLINPC